MPAPITPYFGMKIALKTTSSAHMAALSILGVTMSPLHCRKPEHSELSCEKGSISANTRKYADASARIASSPPSQAGRLPLISAPVRHRRPARHTAVTRPCRTTSRAFSSCLLPI